MVSSRAISRFKFGIDILLGFLLGIAGLVILIFLLWFFTFGKQMIAWQSYQFAIPDTQSQLIFRWKSLHPFLAEYDRTVQVITGDRTSPEYPLLINTGGRHHLNLYLTDTGGEHWLRILDEFTEDAINLQTLDGVRVGRKHGRTFIAPIHGKEYWSYTWDNNNPKNVKATNGDLTGVEDQRFNDIGTFIGTLDARSEALRFIPASEKPEEHIVTQEEQAERMDRMMGETSNQNY
jgi:hypothetical protein